MTAGARARRRRIWRPWHWTRRRWRLAGWFGGLPAAVGTALLLVALLNVLAIRRAPFWVADPRSHLILMRLAGTLLLLGGLQLLLTWALGLWAAIGSAQAVGGAGAELRPRLAIARQRALPLAGMVLALRLLILAVLALGALFILTPLLGRPVAFDPLVAFRRAWAVHPALLASAAALALVHLLSGPWLRIRFSSALGALAATFAARRDQRGWRAASARLGCGLAAALGLIWGMALGGLVYLMAFDPYWDTYRDLPRLFPALPQSIADVMMLALAVTGLAGAQIAAQITLPPLFEALARWRLPRQKRETTRRRAAL